jgi:hypothetical protein
MVKMLNSDSNLSGTCEACLYTYKDTVTDRRTCIHAAFFLNSDGLEMCKSGKPQARFHHYGSASLFMAMYVCIFCV